MTTRVKEEELGGDSVRVLVDTVERRCFEHVFEFYEAQFYIRVQRQLTPRTDGLEFLSSLRSWLYSQIVTRSLQTCGGCRGRFRFSVTDLC